jgi:hypothetical protein
LAVILIETLVKKKKYPDPKSPCGDTLDGPVTIKQKSNSKFGSPGEELKEKKKRRLSKLS